MVYFFTNSLPSLVAIRFAYGYGENRGETYTFKKVHILWKTRQVSNTDWEAWWFNGLVMMMTAGVRRERISGEVSYVITVVYMHRDIF